jgi:acyl-CoA synthetase (AMP-forming)/AMP-acid ligase II
MVPNGGLRVLTVGGDSLATDHVAQLVALRPDRELYLTYGLTQAGPRVSTLAAHAEPPQRYGSVGLPLADTRVSLASLEDGTDRRQLLVSSDTVMRRRIGVIEGRRFDDWHSPGVVASGDVFEQDDAGYLFYKGRLSEYILREGEKICLAAVRRIATALPGVVSARTTVTKGEHGEDFDLTLFTAGAAGDAIADATRASEQYRSQLGRALRRGELPRSITVLPASATQSEQYK